MAKKKKYILGIDLGGTKMLGALLDSKAKVLVSEKTKMHIDHGEKHFLNLLDENIQTLLKKKKIKAKEVRGLGIGCPGIIDPKKGEVISCPNIPFLENFSLAKKIHKLIHVPIFVGNDVNVGLLGEQGYGSARGYKHVIGIFPGTGVGGALIFNNELYLGATGGAGEIGHMGVDPMGDMCGCGQRGCLETFIGRLGVAGEAAVLAIKQQAPKLYDEVGADISKMKSGVLAKAIKAGDKALKELIEYRAKRLGMAMGSLVNILNPEMFVLGGGLVEALGDLILPAAEAAMRKSAMPALAQKVKVAAAKLGDYAIVKGAAAMVLAGKRKDS